MNAIIPFIFDGAQVRAMMSSGEAVFVARDVAAILGYVNPQTIVIPERDVYRLIMRSKLPAAERFEEWVVGTVLPAIRKDGGYMVAAPDETPEELALRALTVLQATVERQKAQLAVTMPKAAALDRLATAQNSLTLRETAKEMGEPERKFALWLHAIGWIFRLGGYGAWLGYASREKEGLVEHVAHTYRDADGNLQNAPQVRITAKGMARLAMLLNGRAQAA